MSTATVESERRPLQIPLAGAGAIATLLVVGWCGSTTLAPLWIDAEVQIKYKYPWMHKEPEYRKVPVDPFFMLLAVNILFTTVLVVINALILKLSTESLRDDGTYSDKRLFALVGTTDAVGTLILLFSSSRDRTALHTKSLAANAIIPFTFALRFLILKKRPTCRKLLCVILVLVAGATAPMPDITGIASQNTNATHGDGQESGLGDNIWSLGYALGFFPLAISTVVMEKLVKGKPAATGQDGNTISASVHYVLAWCYFFSLLSQVVLFWVDIIPGFGMTDGVVDFAKLIWLNTKCFFGFEGCVGEINYTSLGFCIFMSWNRVVQAYFLKYLEGANLMAITLLIATPLVYLFFSVFDDGPLAWNPHADMSTWLSIVSFCIMIPAIYIYCTGAAEVDYNISQPEDTDIEDEQAPLLRQNNRPNNNHPNRNDMPFNQRSDQRPYLWRVHSTEAGPKKAEADSNYGTGGTHSFKQDPYHSTRFVDSANPVAENELFGDGTVDDRSTKDNPNVLADQATEPTSTTGQYGHSANSIVHCLGGPDSGYSNFDGRPGSYSSDTMPITGHFSTFGYGEPTVTRDYTETSETRT